METHPFGNFVPKNTKYLFLGTFTGKVVDPSYDWFFGTKRNQFWTIMEQVYETELKTKEQKQKLFTNLHLAITDMILSCERKDDNNSDTNLINVVINREVENILNDNYIEKIFFSSQMAAKLFKKHFKELSEGRELITLPSPSPRYAAISREEKVKRCKDLLPRLT